MPERIVTTNEATALVKRYAMRLITADTEMSHFTLYYEMNPAKGTEKCSGYYCTNNAVVLRFERDHRGQNFVSFYCESCIPRSLFTKMDNI